MGVWKSNAIVYYKITSRLKLTAGQEMEIKKDPVTKISRPGTANLHIFSTSYYFKTLRIDINWIQFNI
jgi:hypothetical protein